MAEEKEKKMKELKVRIFRMLLGQISIENFEQWLYTNTYVLDNLNNDPFIFNLVDKDYSYKFIKDEVVLICRSEFNFDDEFAVYFAQQMCIDLKVNFSDKNISYWLRKAYTQYGFDSKYKLMHRFYLFDDEWEMAEYSYGIAIEVRSSLLKFISNVIVAMEDKTTQEKIELLKKGIDEEGLLNKDTDFSTSNKKWFEFWK